MNDKPKNIRTDNQEPIFYSQLALSVPFNKRISRARTAKPKETAKEELVDFKEAVKVPMATADTTEAMKQLDLAKVSKNRDEPSVAPAVSPVQAKLHTTTRTRGSSPSRNRRKTFRRVATVLLIIMVAVFTYTVITQREARKNAAQDASWNAAQAEWQCQLKQYKAQSTGISQKGVSCVNPK